MEKPTTLKIAMRECWVPWNSLRITRDGSQRIPKPLKKPLESIAIPSHLTQILPLSSWIGFGRHFVSCKKTIPEFVFLIFLLRILIFLRLFKPLMFQERSFNGKTYKPRADLIVGYCPNSSSLFPTSVTLYLFVFWPIFLPCSSYLFFVSLWAPEPVPNVLEDISFKIASLRRLTCSWGTYPFPFYV